MWRAGIAGTEQDQREPDRGPFHYLAGGRGPKARTLGVAAERFYDMLCELGRKQVRDGIWEAAA